MHSLDDVGFDSSGFERKDAGNPTVWLSPYGDGVGRYYFDLPPDLGAALDDLPSLRAYYRNMADDSGLGIVEVECLAIAGVRVVRTIIKVAQEPTGRSYVGSLTIPFRDFSYVLKVQSVEHPPTGMRDAVVFAELNQQGVVQLKDGAMHGWLLDPYDPDITGPMTRNRSELPAYDAAFPTHPLSRVRATLKHIEATLRVSESVRRAVPFQFNAGNR